MDFARLSEQRDIFITDNVVSILGLPESSVEEYGQALSLNDEKELTRIENMVDRAMMSIHPNHWDDYLVMIAHFIFRERKSDLVTCLLAGKSFTPFKQYSLIFLPPAVVISQESIEDALMKRHQKSTPPRLLSIFQAIKDAVG